MFRLWQWEWALLGPTIFSSTSMYVFLEHHYNWAPLIEMNCLRNRNLLRTFVIITGAVFDIGHLL